VIPSPPEPDQSPTARRRSAAVPVLAVLSSVLAVALVAVSLAWWTERDEAGADAHGEESSLEPSAVPEPAEPRDGATEDRAPTGDSNGGDSWQPDDGPEDGEDESGSASPDTAEDPNGDSPVERLLEGLLGGSLGEAADQLSGLSPQCLGGSVWDLLRGLGGGDELSGTLAEQVRQIGELVEEHRGLRFPDPVEPQLVPAAEFDQQLADQVSEEYTTSAADIDGRVLSLLGAIPEELDLRSFQIDLLAGQVAGYYDPDTGDIVVRDDGDGELDTTEQMALAHELDHALTDAALGLPDTEADGQTDANLAALALIEGDATLLMQQWALANLGLGDQFKQLLDPQAAQAQAELSDVPPYLRQELMFPYLVGLSYACRLYSEGKWPAVDSAYDAPPATTAEILYPDRSGEVPVDAADPGLPGPAWAEASRDTIGAAQLLWLFSAPGGDEAAALPDAREVASRWAGGEMVLATDADRSALGVSLVDRADGYALCDAVDRWYGATSDGDRRTVDGATVTFESTDRVALLTCAGRDVRLGIGPDRATAMELVD
jgi:hypothetical protein